MRLEDTQEYVVIARRVPPPTLSGRQTVAQINPASTFFKISNLQTFFPLDLNVPLRGSSTALPLLLYRINHLTNKRVNNSRIFICRIKGKYERVRARVREVQEELSRKAHQISNNTTTDRIQEGALYCTAYIHMGSY